jgi:hypothetical protein
LRADTSRTTPEESDEEAEGAARGGEGVVATVGAVAPEAEGVVEPSMLVRTFRSIFCSLCGARGGRQREAGRGWSKAGDWVCGGSGGCGGCGG